jgi:pterin-4a-carbinolamine dehydratase
MINLPIWLKPVTSTDLIRLGRKNDGGYLVQKNIISNKEIPVSFGVNDDWSFENDFLSLNKKCKIFLFDRSVSFFQILKLTAKNIFHLPNLVPLINSLQAIISYHFFFSKKNVTFFPYFVGRQIKNESKKLVECLDLIKTELKDIVIKVDIEGSEYRILDELVQNRELIDILIIEFHDIDLHLDSIEKFIKNFSFHIAHLHVNNYSKPDSNGLPKDIEITFQKRLSSVDDNLESRYPLPIDMPSNRLNDDSIINWI